MTLEGNAIEELGSSRLFVLRNINVTFLCKGCLPPGSTPTSVPYLALGDSTWCSDEFVRLLQKGCLSDFLCQFHFHPFKLTLKRFSRGSVINRGICSPLLHWNTHKNPSHHVTRSRAPCIRAWCPWGSVQSCEMTASPEQCLPQHWLLRGPEWGLYWFREPVRDCSKVRDKGFHSSNKQLSQ